MKCYSCKTESFFAAGLVCQKCYGELYASLDKARKRIIDLIDDLHALKNENKKLIQELNEARQQKLL